MHVQSAHRVRCVPTMNGNKGAIHSGKYLMLGYQALSSPRRTIDSVLWAAGLLAILNAVSYALAWFVSVGFLFLTAASIMGFTLRFWIVRR